MPCCEFFAFVREKRPDKKTFLESAEHKPDRLQKLKYVVSNSALARNSNCLEIAHKVTFFLTGESISYLAAFDTSLLAKDFFLKKGKNYSNGVINDLFANFNTAEHSIFLIRFDDNAHACVVEKEWSKGTLQYRVYQSWFGEYTLIDWLEGRGKKPFSQKELTAFIKNLIKRIAKENKSSNCCSFFCDDKQSMFSIEMSKLKFDDHRLDWNYDRITKTVPSEQDQYYESLLIV